VQADSFGVAIPLAYTGDGGYLVLPYILTRQAKKTPMAEKHKKK
jgi:hypothetical protein